LQGRLKGDALHAVLCAAGFNIRWLLRAITRLGLRAVFLALLRPALPGKSGLWAALSAVGRLLTQSMPQTGRADAAAFKLGCI